MATLPTTPLQVPKVELQCPQCSAPLIIDQPILKIVNDREFSLAAAGHLDVNCTACSTTFRMALVGISSANWALMPIPRRSGIIKPPPGMIV